MYKSICKKKIGLNYLPSDKLIPIKYKGIETDVVESGEFESLGFTDRIRPVPGGYSIGSSEVPLGGTMSCMVHHNGEYYILGCNHFLAFFNTLPLGTSIIQPSLNDHGVAPRDTVAALYKFIPLQLVTSTHSSENYVDCAIAKISNMSLVSNKIALLGAIHKIILPSLDQSVRKVGKTTGITYGYVTAFHATTRLNISTTKELIFKDQIITTAMADKGDSGSLLMDLNNNAVGMIVGGSIKSKTTVTPITTVLNSLNVELVTGGM